MPHELVVSGLDGSNPLGFLAALGILRVLSEQARAHDPPRLAWHNEGAWRPVILSQVASFDDLSSALQEDLRSWAAERILAFKYPKLEKAGLKMVAGLRPPLGVLRAWLRATLDDDAQRTLSYACALFSETGVEEAKGEKVVSAEVLAEHGIVFDGACRAELTVMPTNFDFTSRNAQFLDQLCHIRESLTAEAIEEELKGRPSPLIDVRRMDWDPIANVPGAIQPLCTIPIKPTAEWLAFRGLAHLPVFGRRGDLDVTACRGKRKNGKFVWSIWDGALGTDVVRSLLSIPDLEDAPQSRRRVAGIVQVYAAALGKAADGYSGRFEPSTVV